MYFDKACGIVETHVPMLRPVIDRASLFHIDAAPHEVLEKSIPADEVQILNDTFFLPFSTVAVEDRSSLVILEDTVEDQQGMSTERRWYEFLPLDFDEANYRPVTDAEKQSMGAVGVNRQRPSGMPPDAFVIAGGTIKMQAKDGNGFEIEGSLAFAMVATPKRVLTPPSKYRNAPNHEKQMVVRSELANAATTMQEVRYFNSPARFVVERTPAKAKREGKKKIARAHERPLYTLLTPGEIRERLGIGHTVPSAGPAKAPHQRRRHYRVLKSDRYTQAKGRVLTIPATWVGPTEATVRRSRYKVRVDL